MSSDVIKICFVISVAFSFPLVIFPCRASLYSLLYRHGHSESNPYIPETKFRTITAAIVFCSLLVSLIIPSVELVIGLVGSTIGIAICIVFPSCCFTKVSKKDSSEKWLAKLMIVAGCCLMVLGTYANLSAIDDKAAQAAAAAVVHVPEISLNGDHGLVHEEALKNLEYKAKEEELVKAEMEAKKIIEDKKIIEEIKDAKKLLEVIIEKKEQEISIEEKVAAAAAAAVQSKTPEQEVNKNPLNNDAIRKEEEEEERSDDDKEMEKEKKLPEVKAADVHEELHAVVDEMKRQNEESQKRVLEKLEEIVDKIEHKLEPDGPHTMDRNVLEQVKDKFPDPIPLRALNNNNVQVQEEHVKGALVNELKQEEHEDEVKLVNLTNVVDETKDQAMEDGGDHKVVVVAAEEQQPVKEVQKKTLEDNKSKKEEAGEEQEIKKKKETVVEAAAEKKHDEDADAIRRDLLNIDNESLGGRLKRGADCEKEI